MATDQSKLTATFSYDDDKVTMDQILVDVGEADVQIGDDVVLLGRQGTECITADEWAERLGTIPYEVVTRLGGRLPRRHVTGDEGGAPW